MQFDKHNKPIGARRLYLASQHSFRALKWLALHEAAFRQELILLGATGLLILFSDLSPAKNAALLTSVLLVMLAEIINTGIEATIDRISLDLHPLSGLAKDLGSAAVSVAMLIAVIIWLAVWLS